MPSHHYHHPNVRPLSRDPSAHQRKEERRPQEPPPSRRAARGGPGERARARAGAPPQGRVS
jgi:hypothetical protein